MQKYTKLKDLVGGEFTVEKVWGYKFKMWDPQANRMLVSDNWEKGYRKMYNVDTDKGQLDLSANQLGNMLEGVQHSGKADVIGATFSVKSNGKTGIDIRYYINAVRTPQKRSEDVVEEPADDWKPTVEDIDVSSIPF